MHKVGRASILHEFFFFSNLSHTSCSVLRITPSNNFHGTTLHCTSTVENDKALCFSTKKVEIGTDLHFQMVILFNLSHVRGKSNEGILPFMPNRFVHVARGDGKSNHRVYFSFSLIIQVASSGGFNISLLLGKSTLFNGRYTVIAQW